MKVKMTIEVELHIPLEYLSEEEKSWVEKEVLCPEGKLVLFSDEIGDSVGGVTKVSDIRWDDEPVLDVHDY